GNPFVPRIKSIELHQHDADIRSENNFYVAKLERLTRTKHSLGDEIASHVEAEYLKVRERYRKDNSDTAKARSLLGYNDEASAPKPLLEVVDIIYRLTRKDRCLDHDFKSANVMLRGKQVVLTDPIYADDLG